MSLMAPRPSAKSGARARLPLSAAALLLEFGEMTDAEQLQVYAAILDYLNSGGQAIEPDEQMSARLGALDALTRVVAHLGLEDARALEAKRFDAVPSEVRNGWSSQRVLRAWGTWNFAKEAAAGGKTRPTARQRALTKAAAKMRLLTDSLQADYIVGVRVWLAADPPLCEYRAYDEWRKEQNLTRLKGEVPYPSFQSISKRHGLVWKAILAVARGEITLDDAQARLRTRQADVTGDHDLVSTREIVAITGMHGSTLQSRMAESGFPVPVLVIVDRRYWLREDIEAYRDGKPVPIRKHNELEGIYIDAVEASEILGVSRAYLTHPGLLPDPVFKSAHQLWRRADVEALRVEREANPPRPGSRRRSEQTK
jgi:predicted DNA-binding transcriptional regulator AlpA